MTTSPTALSNGREFRKKAVMCMFCSPAGRQETEESCFPDLSRRFYRVARSTPISVGTSPPCAKNGWAPREKQGIKLLHGSRVLLEAVVRELLRKHGNVGFVEATRITGLIVDDGRSRVLGVKTISGDNRATTGELLANLVVDASGRSSKAPNWLEEIGFPAPEEIIVDSHSGYASRWFQAPAPEKRPKEWWWKAAWIDPKIGENPFAGVLFPVENNRWVVSIAGVGKNYPPSDEDAYMAALTRLRSPLIAEAVKHATPISPVYSHRSFANRWRRYDKWSVNLGGFVALGDSACAFNPVYGQGMTTGALSALALRDTIVKLGLDHPGLPGKFHAAQAKLQKAPWGMATGADFAVPEVDGYQPISGESDFRSLYFGSSWSIPLMIPSCA